MHQSENFLTMSTVVVTLKKVSHFKACETLLEPGTNLYFYCNEWMNQRFLTFLLWYNTLPGIYNQNMMTTNSENPILSTSSMNALKQSVKTRDTVLTLPLTTIRTNVGFTSTAIMDVSRCLNESHASTERGSVSDHVKYCNAPGWTGRPTHDIITRTGFGPGRHWETSSKRPL